jgi:hypothetical protein
MKSEHKSLQGKISYFKPFGVLVPTQMKKSNEPETTPQRHLRYQLKVKWMTDRKNNKKPIGIDVDTAKISGICK